MNIQKAKAEPVADDTAGTTVTTNGNQFDIGGGTKAGDNLFHSFKKFGLSQGQIANFLSNPNIRNILGRVTGGEASIINGLIQVTGGNSNLFLINPAGIIFGKDATINVPASFTATTANGIQIGDFWFDALGSNNYSNLVGEPNGFAFVTDEPGSIINGGNLSVSQGETINLVGGLVINTGTLEAPEGKINITAVPEKQLVKISPEGSLLSLALPTQAESILGAELITPQDLPTLLTGGDIQAATGVEVADNGTIKLTGSDTAIPSDVGTTIASGNLDVSGNSGGNVNVLGDKVGIVRGEINASGTNDGGNILIGGDYKGQGEVPNASRTFIDSNSVITADALADGNGGKVIAWADEVTAFYGKISATGGSNSGDGGFVEVSGKDGLIFEGDVDLTAVNGLDGTLLLDPAIIEVVGESAGNNDDLISDNPEESVEILNSNSDLPNKLTISIDKLVGKDVILEATDSIIFNIDKTGLDSDRFKRLTAIVTPSENQTGIIQVLGNISADNSVFSENQITLENTNGDIIIGSPGEPRSISVIINQAGSPEEPTGADINIKAPNGNVELFGGIFIQENDIVRSDTNDDNTDKLENLRENTINIDAKRFRATETFTQRGREINIEDESQRSQVNFNLSVLNENSTNSESNIPIEPIEPNLKFTLEFINEESNEQQPPIEEIVDKNKEIDYSINITLRQDTNFTVGTESTPNVITDPNISGIVEDISIINNPFGGNGSVSRGTAVVSNTSFPPSDNISSSPNQGNPINNPDNETIAKETNPEPFLASFCNEELNVTTIAGSDNVKVTCTGQTLAFIFPQPKDENGNPLAITKDLFPELLTGDEVIEIDENTSFNFWIPQDREENLVRFTFGKRDLQNKIEN